MSDQEITHQERTKLFGFVELLQDVGFATAILSNRLQQHPHTSPQDLEAAYDAALEDLCEDSAEGPSLERIIKGAPALSLMSSWAIEVCIMGSSFLVLRDLIPGADLLKKCMELFKSDLISLAANMAETEPVPAVCVGPHSGPPEAYQG